MGKSQHGIFLCVKVEASKQGEIMTKLQVIAAFNEFLINLFEALEGHRPMAFLEAAKKGTSYFNEIYSAQYRD